MKPKTFCKTVRFTEQMITDWSYLTSIHVRPADILRNAAGIALNEKAKEMMIIRKNEKLPF
jgi:hypothetical protein